MAVCMYVVSLDFMACETRRYLSRDTNMRVLRTHEGEETFETLKREAIDLLAPELFFFKF